MRLYPLAIIPLVLAFVALVMAGYTSGTEMYLTIGVAIATLLVTIATLFQYVKSSPEAKQVPLENFSLWADIGEPVSELRRLSPNDVNAAVRITIADLGSLQANAELLGTRTSLLLNKPGFEGFRQEKIHRRVENMVNDLRAVIEKLKADDRFSADILASLEQCAAQADRVANKLFEYKHGKSETVHIYIEPLRRAAEKLSRDIRLASTNISNFTQGPAPSAA